MEEELAKLRAELAAAKRTNALQATFAQEQMDCAKALRAELAAMRATVATYITSSAKCEAELAAAHRLLDAARYELRFEGSAKLLDGIDAALAKKGTNG